MPKCQILFFPEMCLMSPSPTCARALDHAQSQQANEGCVLIRVSIACGSALGSASTHFAVHPSGKRSLSRHGASGWNSARSGWNSLQGIGRSQQHALCRCSAQINLQSGDLPEARAGKWTSLVFHKPCMVQMRLAWLLFCEPRDHDNT